MVDAIFLLVLPLKIILLAAFKSCQMGNVIIARTASLDKKEIVKLVLKIVRFILVTVDVSVAKHNSLSCLMNADIIIF